jgi:glycosyltransferase involved in cell wall biosynthesis
MNGLNPSDRPLRVCLVTPSFTPDLGGLASIASGLATGLANLGCEVEVATQVIARNPRGASSVDPVPVHRFRTVIGGRRFGYSPKLTWWVWRHQRRFDVIHTYSYHAPVGLATAVTVSRPIVFTPTFHGGGHSPLASVVHLAYRRVSGLTFHTASAIICGSNAERGLLIDAFPRVKNKVTVIPFAVEERTKVDAVPMDVDEPVILSAGRLDDYKRNDMLIRAMAHLRRPGRLVVCGSGPDRGRLERLAIDASVAPRVDFLGYVSDADLARWRVTATVIASLSTHESFGLSLVEGALTGANLVLSDIGPHREVAQLLGVDPVFVGADAHEEDVANALDVALARPRSPSPPQLATWDDRASETIAVYEESLVTKRSR